MPNRPQAAPSRRTPAVLLLLACALWLVHWLMPQEAHEGDNTDTFLGWLAMPIAALCTIVGATMAVLRRR